MLQCRTDAGEAKDFNAMIPGPRPGHWELIMADVLAVFPLGWSLRRSFAIARLPPHPFPFQDVSKVRWWFLSSRPIAPS